MYVSKTSIINLAITLTIILNLTINSS